MTDEDDLLAAEFALGLIEGSEAEVARARVRTDAGFRAAVAAWSQRMAPLLAEVDPVDPPADTWAAIVQRLEPAGDGRDNVVRLERRARRWRAVAAGATALAASLAVALLSFPHGVFERPRERRSPAPLVATIATDKAAPPAIVATWSPATRQLVMVLTGPMPTPPGRVHQLWAIPADGKPRSLGVMPDAPRLRMTLPDAQAELLRSGAQLAVSVEPAGGSTTGLPTGPVIASGQLSDA